MGNDRNIQQLVQLLNPDVAVEESDGQSPGGFHKTWPLEYVGDGIDVAFNEQVMHKRMRTMSRTPGVDARPSRFLVTELSEIIRENMGAEESVSLESESLNPGEFGLPLEMLPQGRSSLYGGGAIVDEQRREGEQMEMTEVRKRGPEKDPRL